MIWELLHAGARGHIPKTDAKRYLIGAIEGLAAHKPFFTGQLAEALLESFVRGPTTRNRHLQTESSGVIQLIAEEHSNQQTATILK
jgi:DNA-binding NarL/FixJ family response regulator